MAYMFGTDEWAKAFMEEINKNEAYAKAASDWEGDFYFVVQPKKMFDKQIILYLDLWHGKCRDASVVEDESEHSPAYKLIASDDNWKAIIDRKLDPIRGMMIRKLKLEGDMGKIMRYVKAAQELVNSATRVPTEFPPEK
jgi:putative sterol carrier protein